MCETVKTDETTVIEENVEIAPGFYRMRLQAPKLGSSFLPGQFFQFRINSNSKTPLLRRPFAPSDFDGKGFSLVYLS